MAETPRPKRTQVEQLIANLRNRYASIDAQIIDWSRKADELRVEQIEINEALRRLESTG